MTKYVKESEKSYECLNFHKGFHNDQANYFNMKVDYLYLQKLGICIYYS